MAEEMLIQRTVNDALHKIITRLRSVGQMVPTFFFAFTLAGVLFPARFVATEKHVVCLRACCVNQFDEDQTFTDPVTVKWPTLAREYRAKIKEPMDLYTMGQKVRHCCHAKGVCRPG